MARDLDTFLPSLRFAEKDIRNDKGIWKMIIMTWVQQNLLPEFDNGIHWTCESNLCSYFKKLNDAENSQFVNEWRARMELQKSEQYKCKYFDHNCVNWNRISKELLLF